MHEAYIRLVDVEQVQHWDSRVHFFTAAADAMRRISRGERTSQEKSLKAGGAMKRVDLDDAEVTLDPFPDELLALDEAITKLANSNRAAADLAKLRLFAGLT